MHDNLAIHQVTTGAIHPVSEQTIQEQPAAHPATDPQWYAYLQWMFSFHILNVRQKVFTIAEKYYVTDEHGQGRFYVVRPPHIGLNMVASLCAFAVMIVFLVTAYRLLFGAGQILPAILVFIIGGNIAALTRLLLAPYRDITIYTDETETVPVLRVTQENKLALYRRYAIHDAMGNLIAEARRNTIASVFRRRWKVYTPSDGMICLVEEDSLMLALLRRWLGSFWGLLRTNFDFRLPDGHRVGEFNRKLAIIDSYFLDLRQDPWYLLDRRVCLAMAILLDTAEGR